MRPNDANAEAIRRARSVRPTPTVKGRPLTPWDVREHQYGSPPAPGALVTRVAAGIAVLALLGGVAINMLGPVALPDVAVGFLLGCLGGALGLTFAAVIMRWSR